MAVSADGAAGFHRHRSNDVVAVDACPQTVPGALDGVVGTVWNRGSELQTVPGALDGVVGAVWNRGSELQTVSPPLRTCPRRASARPRWSRSWAGLPTPVDVVVLDPPRSGAGRHWAVTWLCSRGSVMH